MKEFEGDFAYITDGASMPGATAARRIAEGGAKIVTVGIDDPTEQAIARVLPDAFRVPVVTSEREPGGHRDPVDDTLDASFPASDPPSWTLGLRASGR